MTLARDSMLPVMAKLLGCASPLALFGGDAEFDPGFNPTRQLIFAPCESGRGLPHSKTQARGSMLPVRAKLLDCASPLALFGGAVNVDPWFNPTR